MIWNAKSLLTTPSNVLPVHLKPTFLPIFWIFTESDGIKSKLPFKNFLLYFVCCHKEQDNRNGNRNKQNENYMEYGIWIVDLADLENLEKIQPSSNLIFPNLWVQINCISFQKYILLFFHIIHEEFEGALVPLIQISLLNLNTHFSECMSPN